MEIVPDGAISPFDAVPKPLAHTEPVVVPSQRPAGRVRAIGASACSALSDDSGVEGGEVDASVCRTNSNVASFPQSQPWLGASSKMSYRAGAA